MVDIEAYADKIRPLLPLATKAYGSRDTVSPQHDASRAYTQILVEYHDAGGSLPKLAAILGVSYAGLRRRVSTASLPTTPKVQRVKYTDEQYKKIVEDLLDCKDAGTDYYYEKLLETHEAGYSFTRIAREMGLSSPFPLYYGTDRARAQRDTNNTETP